MSVAAADQALLAAVDGRCAFQIARDVAASALDDELVRWLDPAVPASELQPLALARLVTHEVRWVGKHFLQPARLTQLDAVRARHRGHDPYLDAFLECLLDKHDGHFWNRTYLLLPVLEMVLEKNGMHPSGLAALLAADIIRHELCAAHRLTEVALLGRPDPRTLRARLRHSLRFTTAHLGGADSGGLLSGIARDPESDLAALLLLLPNPPSVVAADWLELTVQQVSTVHDEYFFMRVLQAHEMSFAGMNTRVRDVVAALRAGDLATAEVLLGEVVTFMDRNASLFRLVATMRPEAFHSFREFTDGASAIQSEQYKRFEGLCGLPPEERISSPAFDSVPVVQAEVVDGYDSLTDAFGALAASGRDAEGVATVQGLMRDLEDSHRRWKATHVTLATRMLGEEARGSGYTSGVGYLRQWVDHRLFWRLPEIGVTEDRRRPA